MTTAFPGTGGTADRDTPTGWWARLRSRPGGGERPGRATDAEGEWHYAWLLPGDAACAMPPDIRP